jgi:signal transduction histidine kinase
MLDEAGLESTLDWYIPTVERQTGIAISYEKQGEPFRVDGGSGVHIYRILQEALNNVARHSGAKRASVCLRFLPRTLELEVQDHGTGFPERPGRRGIGLVAMRERSELMGGQLVFSRPPEGGTLVHLIVPREKAESYAKEDHSVARG